MNPHFFGSPGRRLFGIHEAPRRSSAERGVVLCHPWGAEYIYAYRAMRQLAKMLSANGFHTLRFDYYGTGESDGEAEMGDLGGWESDIEAAITELKDTINTSQVSLIGLRLGAALAANVAIRRDVDVKSLVMWDPVVSGTEYLAEISRPSRGRSPQSVRKSPRGDYLEIAGFPLSKNVASALEGIDLAEAISSLSQKTALVASQSLPSHARLKQTLDQRPAQVFMEYFDDAPVWIEWPIDHPLAGTVPVKLLQRIVQWLT